MSDAYDLFREGQKRLRGGMAAQATVPLERAKRLEPAKASIREALGIAYFRLGRWQDAEGEFRTIVEELAPTDDYAHYALGRALERQGRDRRGERALQARKLDGPGVGAVRVTHPRSRRRRQGRATSVRAVVQRVARASSSPGGSIGARSLHPSRRRGGRRPGRRPPAGRGRSRACGSSRATTAGSTGRCSRPAARRSSSASSRCSRTPRRATARASRARRGRRRRSRSYERSADDLRALGIAVETGVFGAKMAVELVNDGPVTIVLRE